MGLANTYRLIRPKQEFDSIKILVHREIITVFKNIHPIINEITYPFFRFK